MVFRGEATPIKSYIKEERGAGGENCGYETGKTLIHNENGLDKDSKDKKKKKKGKKKK